MNGFLGTLKNVVLLLGLVLLVPVVVLVVGTPLALVVRLIAELVSRI
jgi:hypothetical protein